MKAPWIRLIIAGLALLLIIAGTHYSLKRLPPSKVNLVFKGWKNSGTNAYACFDLTNMGPRSIYWGLDGALILELETGWVTNRFEHFTYSTLGTPRGSNETVSVKIPIDAKRWLIRVDYSSFQKHNVRLETIRRIVDSGAADHMPNFMGDFIGGLLGLIPMPTEEYHVVLSDVFTNRAYSEADIPLKSR